MESLGEELVKTLDNGTAFTIPIGNGIPIPESVVVTWCIMAFVVVVSIIFTHNLKIVPKGPQLYVEALVGFILSLRVFSEKKVRNLYLILAQLLFI